MVQNTEQFRSWIKTHHLTRATDEPDIQFAYRVHEFLRNHLEYGKPATDKWEVDAIAKCGQADCFGLSRIFVAVLRANRIPSRGLPGRGINDGGTHVKAEFFAEGVGWVPVEVAGGVSDKHSPLTNYFGKDHADMFVIPNGLDYSFTGPRGAVNVGSCPHFAVVLSNGTFEFPVDTWTAQKHDF